MNPRVLFFKILLFSFFIALAYFILRSAFYHKDNRLREEGYEAGKFFFETNNLGRMNSFTPVDLFIVRDGITAYAFDRQGLGEINNFGFRSPDFLTRENRDSRPCIGLIGDSFTFGMSANPIDSSFADRLRLETGFYVDNFGIEGAGLHEYFNVMSYYIPMFHPDRVYVILSDGDLIDYLKDENPDYPFQYGSDIGAFPAYDEAGRFRFKNIYESRDYYLENYTLLNNHTLLGKWASRSALGAQLWKKYFWNHIDTLKRGKDFSPKSWWYFDKMDSLCRQFRVDWKIVVIPHRDQLLEKQQYIKLNSNHFRQHDFLFVELTKGDYAEGGDTHTDNAGHFKIMQAIENDLRDWIIMSKSKVD